MSNTVTVEVDKERITADGIAAVEVQGMPLALCKVGGTYYAFHDSCTHEEWPLSEGYLVDGRPAWPRRNAL
jgi:nitrite reductase/ring-hydroxylating ferredoxin subunit